MSVAWTTVLFIFLLLPGVFFFAGLAARERSSRELIRTNAVEDLGLAISAAVVAHFLAWQIVRLLPYDPASHIVPFFYSDLLLPSVVVRRIITEAQYALLYIATVSAITFLFGMLLAFLISRGYMRFLVRHKWVYDLLGNKDGLVTAYVMTKAETGGFTLMYKGVLTEFYLAAEGKISYVVLKDCSSFTMQIKDGLPVTGDKRELFQETSPDRKWNYLTIDGANIANILFDKSVTVTSTAGGQKALDAALEELEQAIESATRSARRASPPSGTSPSARRRPEHA